MPVLNLFTYLLRHLFTSSLYPIFQISARGIILQNYHAQKDRSKNRSFVNTIQAQINTKSTVHVFKGYYQLAFVTPGNKPWCAIFLRQILQRPKSL